MRTTTRWSTLNVKCWEPKAANICGVGIRGPVMNMGKSHGPRPGLYAKNENLKKTSNCFYKIASISKETLILSWTFATILRICQVYVAESNRYTQLAL